MIGNRTKRNTTGCAIILAALVILGLDVSGAAAAWRPARPDANVDRYRLEPVVPVEGETYTRSSYVLLAAGETVSFSVVGEGEIRVRTRPVYPGPERPGHFRIAVCFDDTTCRRFKRLSQPEQEFLFDPVGEAAAPGLQLLGTENALDLDVPRGVRKISLVNRNEDGRALYIRLLLKDGLVQSEYRHPSGISDDEQLPVDLRIAADPLQIGYDSNAYLASADANDNQARLFWPVRFSIDVRNLPDSRLELRADYSFSGRIYTESVLNEYRNRLKLSQGWQPDSGSRWSDWTFAVEEGIYRKKTTFFGRGDDVELETVTQAGDTISLADRFHSTTFHIEPFVEWRWSRNWTAGAALRLQARDYSEDYTAYSDIYSLDQTTVEPTLEVTWRALPDLRLAAEAQRADKKYDEKFVRDASGNTVTGTEANYVKTSALLAADWGRRTGLQLGGETKVYTNKDQYEGYWDYSGLAVEMSAGWRWAEGHRVDLKARHANTDYDLSHVGNDPALPLRAKTVWNLRASGEYALREHLDVVARLHYKDYDYNSRTFAYTRLLVQGGVRWGF